MEKVFKDGRYEEHLKIMAKFSQYSAINQLLIGHQMPNAEIIKSFDDWQMKYDRPIKENAKPINIVYPRTFKKEVLEKVKMPNGEYEDALVEREITFFRKIGVFDISQTYGDNFKDIVPKFSPETAPYYVKALIHNSPVEVLFLKTDTEGYFDRENNKIVINEGLGEEAVGEILVNIIPRAIVESEYKNPEFEMDSLENEIKIGSIAFILSKKFGLDTSGFDFSTIKDWARDKHIGYFSPLLKDIQKHTKQLVWNVERRLKRDIKIMRYSDINYIDSLKEKKKLSEAIKDVEKTQENRVSKENKKEKKLTAPKL